MRATTHTVCITSTTCVNRNTLATITIA
jgi:hypothetical protein